VVVTTPSQQHADGAAASDRPRPGRVVEADRFYADLRSIGLEYGAAFRGVVALRRRRGAAEARGRLPAAVGAERDGLHPAFLDACLHVFPAVLDRSDRSRRADSTYLPVGIERVCVHRDGAIEGRVHAALRPATGAGRPVVDIRVVDEAGRPIVTVDGLSLRALRVDRLGADAPAGLYDVQWEARARRAAGERSTREPGTWLVFAGADEIGARCVAQLGRRGARCHVVRAGDAFARKGTRWTIDPRRPED